MSTRGFTLLEAVVAMTIVGMVSIAALTSVSAATRTAGHAAERVLAAELADERLASLLVLPLHALVDSADGRRHAGPLNGWEWHATVTPSSAGNLAELSVHVHGPSITVEGTLLRPTTRRVR